MTIDRLKWIVVWTLAGLVLLAYLVGILYVEINGVFAH